MRRVDSLMVVAGLLCSGALTVVALKAELPASGSFPEKPFSLYDRTKDPTLGTVLPSIAPKVKGMGGGLIIAMGGCGSCSVSHFDPVVLKQTYGKPALAVFEGLPGKATDSLKGFAAKAYLDTKSYATLNAAWPFRLYTTNARGELTGLQAKDESAEAFAQRCLR